MTFGGGNRRTAPIPICQRAYGWLRGSTSSIFDDEMVLERRASLTCKYLLSRVRTDPQLICASLSTYGLIEDVEVLEKQVSRSVDASSVSTSQLALTSFTILLFGSFSRSGLGRILGFDLTSVIYVNREFDSRVPGHIL